MKKKVLTAVCTVMLFVPWSLLYLRTFPWALETPTAEIMIASYAAFMIFSGIFTIAAYSKAEIQHMWMKLCLVVNCLYMAGGVAALVMMVIPKLTK